jgi:hypothetical protein
MSGIVIHIPVIFITVQFAKLPTTQRATDRFDSLLRRNFLSIEPAIKPKILLALNQIYIVANNHILLKMTIIHQYKTSTYE